MKKINIEVSITDEEYLRSLTREYIKLSHCVDEENLIVEVDGSGYLLRKESVDVGRAK